MPVHSEYVRHERRLFDALVKHAPVVQMSDDLVGDVVKTLEVLAESLNACRAQQRENAETIAALKERVATAERVKKFLSDRLEHHLRIQNVCAEQQGAAEMRENWANIRANKEAEISRGALIQKEEAIARAEAAERANTELDNARKSAEQSARDLRAENAQLRAQLDAMTGEQVPVIDVFCKNNVCMFGSSTFPSTLPDGVHTLYRHPTPAARVVGACVVGVLTAKTDEVTNCTSFHIDTSKYIPSKIVPPDGEYDIWIGAPLPTEGGK